MPDYKYKGRDGQGKVVTDTVNADSESVVAKMLINRSITPLEIKLVEEKAKSSSSSILTMDLFGGKAKPSDLIMFSRQMMSLTRAGMPVATSMLRLAETTKSKQLKNALIGISQEVSAGKTLSLAVSQYPKVFSPIFVNMIDTGEHTGKLEESFKQLTKYLELEASVKKRIKSIMRYPTIVITAIIVAIAVINIMVIPAFANMFKRFGTELPLPTKILLTSSNFFVNYWPQMLTAVLIVLIGLRFYIFTTKGRLVWDHIKVRLPLFGHVIMQVLLMRFSSLFAMVFRSGVPLIKGMSLVANAVGNAYLKHHIVHIRNAVEAGDSLGSATKSTKLFPPLVTQMIEIGEESGSLDNMLEQVSEYYEREVDYDIKRLGDMMEPILLIIIAIMVLILALGVFLPMWEMATFTGA